jgi:hypothetical protein
VIYLWFDRQARRLGWGTNTRKGEFDPTLDEAAPGGGSGPEGAST